MSEASRGVPVCRVDGNEVRAGTASLVEERAIALSFNGSSPVVLMATPTDLEDLILGFALSEQIIDAVGDLRVVEITERADSFVVEAIIPDVAMERVESRRRVLIGNSACGLCGTEQLEQALRPPRMTGVQGVNAVPHSQALAGLLQRFESMQTLNQSTGGAPAAAGVGAEGLVLREDVGRHNAFDKMIGARARANRAGLAGFAIVSSRASYELVHKAVSAGIGALVAISAPTTAALDLANAHGMTLVGFARGKTMTRYTL